MDPTHGNDRHTWYGGHGDDGKFVARPTKVNEVKLRINHGGMFISHPNLMYVKGKVEEMGRVWDIDQISHIELIKVVKSFGYKGFKCMWYRHPKFSLAHGLRPLNSDRDVLKLAEDVKGFDELIDVYVEHMTDIPAIDKEADEVEVVVIDSVEVEGQQLLGETDDAVGDEGEAIDVQVQFVEADEVGDDAEAVDVQVLFEDACEVGDEAEAAESDSESDGEYVANPDEEVESDNVSLDDSDYDEHWDWTSVLPQETVNSIRMIAPPPTQFHDIVASAITATRAVTSSRNPEPTSVADFENEDGDSDLLITPPGSEDDENERPKFPKFRRTDDGSNVPFQVGLIFPTKQAVKEAVKDYAMVQKKNLHFKKNDRKRMVIKCMPDCPFYIRVSKSTQSEYWQVVSLDDSHTCHRTAKNRQAKTNWLARKFIPTLRHTPEMKTKGLVADAIGKWGVKLSRHQAYRAKKRALEIIQGAGSEQYHHLRSYAEELRRSNPNSTVIIKCNMSSEGPVFERIYVCFEASKAAFVHTCRPLIGLDGCFLKGDYGGQLLAAVGKDGNNQMFPLAFAVVEAETRDSWSWFIDLMLEDLGGIQEKGWSFISDQQKELVPTIAALGNGVEHRLCVKHLYGNWRKKYPGIEMKEAMWAAARATTVPAWMSAMDKLKRMNENAWSDIMQLQPSAWTRSAYSTYSKCDLQVNNMCEAFNRAILEYRDKPIITLIEGLKYYMTNRIVNQKDLMLRFRGNICPLVQKILEKNKQEADGWIPNWTGDDGFSLFQVSRDIERYVVNVSQRSCSCRKWDLTGLPCCHAIACLCHNNYAPENYVDSHYRKNTFLATYSHIIMPSNGPNLWPVLDSEPINPPYMRRAPGRPKKQRRKANDEPQNCNKLRRQYTTVKCKKCGKLDHNVRTCKGKIAADREIPKGGNKRQKKKNEAATATIAHAELCKQTQVSANAPHTQESQTDTARS